ncbi:MAG: carbohydrate ABC transporter permease [Microbacterium sp.]
MSDLATGDPVESRQTARHARLHAREARLKFLVGAVATLVALFPLAPIVWMVSTSFKPNSQVFENPPRLITDLFSIDAYIAILSNPVNWTFFANSYMIAGAVVVLTLLVAVHAAYAFSRYDFPGKSIFKTVIISVQAVPPVTLLIPYFGLIVFLGLYNTHLGLILTYIVLTLPYAIIMIVSYLDTLPRELDEAVKVDGGGALTALWRVLIPIMTPALVSVGVYTFILSWNEFLFALTLTSSDDVRTVPIGINLLMGQHAYEWNQVMAMSVLGSLPVVVLFSIFQRFFISGLAAGAVKS